MIDFIKYQIGHAVLESNATSGGDAVNISIGTLRYGTKRRLHEPNLRPTLRLP
jgi:hypothetical protein